MSRKARHRRRRALPHKPPRDRLTVNPERTVARLIIEWAQAEGISVSRLLTEMVEATFQPKKRGGRG